MAVEMLGETRNIHVGKLQIDTVERTSVPESRQLIDALKQTPLYENDTGLFRSSMYSNGELPSYREVLTYDQLLHVMVETKFDKEIGRKKYKEFKGTDVYDSHKKMWDGSLSKVKEAFFLPHADAQLLGTLIEAQFDKNNAQKHYKELKESPLYDRNKKLWKRDLNMYHTGKDEYNTSAQLLEILVAAQFDENNAQELYDNLKETPLYNKDKERWYPAMYEDEHLFSKDFNTSDRLLGIIVESTFDKEQAQEQYQLLKDTMLFDKDTKQWIKNENERFQDYNFGRFTDAQLLGIWLEQLFESEPVFDQQDVPIPKMRRF